MRPKPYNNTNHKTNVELPLEFALNCKLNNVNERSCEQHLLWVKNKQKENKKPNEQHKFENKRPIKDQHKFDFALS